MASDDSHTPGASTAEGSESAHAPTEEDLPAVDFATFILSLSHSALVHLGDAPDPADGKREISLPMARQTIDLLAMLQEKTLGRLSGEEERIMDQALYDLRMRFLEVSKSK